MKWGVSAIVRREGWHPAIWSDANSSPQAVIGGLLSLSRIPTSETGTETDIDTVKLPSDPVRKSLVELNLDQFPPVRRAMGSVDLTMLDEFGSDKKMGKGRQEPPGHRISTAPRRNDLQ